MRFVVCGENLVDLIPAGTVSTSETRWAALAGGSSMNTAVALAALGEDSHFLGRISTDAFGAQILGHLEANQVQLDLAVPTDDPTSLAIVSLDEAGKAHYTFHFDGTAGFSWRAADLPKLGTGDWLHFGSIGWIVGSGMQHLQDFVQTTDAKLSYDLNVRPTVIPDSVEYLRRVEPLMAAVGRSGGIVKASDEDIVWLAGQQDPLPVAEAWVAEHGLAMLVMTLGADGVVAIMSDGTHLNVPGRPVDVVDTVGAGDTFMAGFLSQYVQDPADVETALRHGIAASALVCTRQGANPPTTDEVVAFLAAG